MLRDIDMADIAAPTSPSDQLMKEAEHDTTTKKLPVTVEKPIPYTFDLGNLLLDDANPVGSSLTSEVLVATGRDCAQGLINQILTVCAMESTPDGVYAKLPEPILPLPREKSVPKNKEPTKWERFAAKKGIRAKKRDGKMVFDEDSGDWVPKWGYKGKNKYGENDWLVEVNADKESKTGEPSDERKEKRAERMDRIRRQDRRHRANERNATKG